MFFRYEGTRRKAVDLRNLYHGCTCFLAGSGPQLKEVASDLATRRIVIAAMNNAAAVVRPNICVMADEARNYSNGILLDPSIMKFNYLNLRNPSRVESEIPGTGLLMKNLPNMFFVRGNANTKARAFFLRGSEFVWWKNVFTLSVQILHHLGFKKVVLVGCGFNITMGQKYAYESDMDKARVAYSQRTYDTQFRQVKSLMPIMKKVGFELVSATPDSKLNALIPYVKLEEALKEAEEQIPEHNTVSLGHPLDRKKVEFPNVDLKPVIAGHYLMGLEHRKTVLRALPPGGRMLEWGSGDSTIWFRANMRDDQELVSYENDRLYAAKTGSTYIPFKSGKNATKAEEDLLPGWGSYVSRPGDDTDQKFDVILVDGVVRNECLKEAACGLLKEGGTVFLHDAERDWYEEGKAAYSDAKVHPSQKDYPGPTLWESKSPV